MKYWLSGILISAIGLILARLVSPSITDPTTQIYLYIIGAIVSISGLIVIIAGIRRRRQAKTK